MSTQAFDLHSVYDFKKGSLTSDTFFYKIKYIIML